MAVAEYPAKSNNTVPVKNGYPPSMFLVKVQDKYMCSHCRLVLREPVQSFCGHRFCKKCSETLEHGSRCPVCVEEESELDEYSLLSMESMFPDNAIRRELSRLEVKCPNNTSGCPWKGKYKDLDEHEKACQYAMVSCIANCGQTIMLSKMKQHMDKDCLYRWIKCHFCGTEQRAKDSETHLESCPKVKIKCPFCGKDIIREKLQDHQNPDTGHCTRQYVICPFGCKDLINKDNMQNHLKRCVTQHLDSLLERVLEVENKARESGFAVGGASASNDNSSVISQMKSMEDTVKELQTRFRNLSAGGSDVSDSIPVRDSSGADSASSPEERKFQQLGDKAKAIEQQVSTYEGVLVVFNREIERCTSIVDTYEQQRRADKDLIENMEKKIKNLERVVALKDVALAEQDLRLQALELVSYDGILVWKISEFSKKRQDAMNGRVVSMYSPSFYTGTVGYKMCARLYPNGDGMGKNTHLSLFFVVMRGPYDALLKWPFRQKVTMMLLDQDNREHIIDAFRPDPTSSSFKRPTTEMNIASGCPLFAQYSNLEKNKERYLRDDTIFIKIIVDTSDLP